MDIVIILISIARCAWQDPRIIYDEANRTWWMTYTANGLGTKPPMNRPGLQNLGQNRK